MKIKIHRGTKEIGGTCVEVWTEKTKILLDFGMPLVDRDGKEFDFRKYKDKRTDELIKDKVLPDIKGLYLNEEEMIDGVIISHAHQDHYGLSNYINNNVKYYLGEATHKIIELNSVFTPQDIELKNISYFQKEQPFNIGDITITAYWADHSAFDAYSFLIDADGKSIFYSGDFRKHGRKAGAFWWFTHNAPKGVDYLLLEGTTLGRDKKPFLTEPQIEEELLKKFKGSENINLVYSSGQNIDRLTSIYRACIRSGKIIIVDVYIAKILHELSEFAGIMHPSEEFAMMKVVFPFYTSRRLKNEGHEKVLYQFKKYKITKDEISLNPNKYVMMVRPSMIKDLEHISNIEGGNLIYSMWEGYFDKPDTKKFVDYLTGRGFNIYKIHTSGHADRETLLQMVDAIEPKNIIPIHTFSAGDYKNVFSKNIKELNDGEILQV